MARTRQTARRATLGVGRMGIPPTAKAGRVRQQGDAFPDVFHKATVTTSSAVRARLPHTNTHTLPSTVHARRHTHLPHLPSAVHARPHTHTMGMGAGRIAAGCSRSLFDVRIMLPHILLPAPRIPGSRRLPLCIPVPSSNLRQFPTQSHTACSVLTWMSAPPPFPERSLTYARAHPYTHMHTRMHIRMQFHAHKLTHSCPVPEPGWRYRHDGGWQLVKLLGDKGHKAPLGEP